MKRTPKPLRPGVARESIAITRSPARAAAYAHGVRESAPIAAQPREDRLARAML